MKLYIRETENRSIADLKYAIQIMYALEIML